MILGVVKIFMNGNYVMLILIFDTFDSAHLVI